MRRYNEPIQVPAGSVVDGPKRFRWRNRSFEVTQILRHWWEATPWWQQSEARALRGDEVAMFSGESLESEIWLVTARPRGRGTPDGMYEVALQASRREWLLRAVVD